MTEKRGPGRPRKKPVTIEEILATFNELVDKKIELALAEQEAHLLRCNAKARNEAFDIQIDKIKQLMIELIKEHRDKFHPYCDPKELDQTLRALREYWEQQRRSNDERQT